MSKLTMALLSAASAGTGLLAWAITQNPLVSLMSSGVAGGRLVVAIVAAD